MIIRECKFIESVDRWVFINILNKILIFLFTMYVFICLSDNLMEVEEESCVLVGELRV